MSADLLHHSNSLIVYMYFIASHCKPKIQKMELFRKIKMQTLGYIIHCHKQERTSEDKRSILHRDEGDWQEVRCWEGMPASETQDQAGQEAPGNQVRAREARRGAAGSPSCCTTRCCVHRDGEEIPHEVQFINLWIHLHPHILTWLCQGDGYLMGLS